MRILGGLRLTRKTTTWSGLRPIHLADVRTDVALQKAASGNILLQAGTVQSGQFPFLPKAERIHCGSTSASVTTGITASDDTEGAASIAAITPYVAACLY